MTRERPVLVVGAGAIGTLVGAGLLAGGWDVVFLGRPRQRSAWTAQGIALVDPLGHRQTFPTPVLVVSPQEAAERGPYEALLFCVKGGQTEAAARALVRALPTPPRAVLSFQNGVGNEEILAEAFGPERVVAGTVTLPVTLEGTAARVTKAKGGLGLAPSPATEGTARALAAAWRRAGFTVRLYRDPRRMKWSKLFLNQICNALCALTGLTPREAMDHPLGFELERRALRETIAVMGAAGIRPVALPGYPVPLFFALVRLLPAPLLRPLRGLVVGGRGGKMPSFFLDLERGRATEVEFLNGAVWALGRRLGVPTPVHAGYTRLLRGIAAGEVDRTAFLGRVDRVWEAIYGPTTSS